ncbi:MAG: fatty acid desaturase [Spirochaetales bacterium]|jgi:acyl-lipid omega-6 desaturase (Delta-12 desaturase)|nr:fatty acid desaturase [Spirochaetales bacterium]
MMYIPPDMQKSINNSSSPQWFHDIRAFQKRSSTRGAIQILNTILPYIALWAAMLFLLQKGVSYLAIFPLVIAAAFFLIRTFIIFHDCCHGSFMPGKWANRMVGHFTGVLTFTPFNAWRLSHLKHHATNGQLDHRGTGDVWTMTFVEYRKSSLKIRIIYRSYRNPFMMFVIVPLFLFLLLNRIPRNEPKLREWLSVMLTTAAIAGIGIAISIGFGFSHFLMIQLPIVWICSMVGVWLFYVQHQFNPGYWARDENWNAMDAAMRGASYYRLPAILAWFTGNIGIHHLHHLKPGIPNYMLQETLKATPEISETPPMTLRSSLAGLRINLWHEAERRFLSFRQAHALMR